MSLQVWLPLTQDVHNQGLSGVTPTNNGATIDSSGKLGKCYSFNGSSYLNFNNKIINSTSYSLSFWVNPSNISGNKCIICCRDASNHAFAVYLIGAIIRVDTGTNWSTGQSLTANSWAHVTITADGTNQFIYINGVLAASRVATTTISQITSFCTIGAEHVNGGSIGVYFNGKLNDIRIYSNCLSESEVKELARGLVLHYPLNNRGFGQENLITNSKLDGSWTYPSSSYSDKYSPITTIVPSATQYTLSFDAKSTVDGDKMRTHYYSPNTTTTCVSSQGITKTATDGNMDFTLTTQWERYWVIYTQTETTAVKHLICPRLVSGQGTGTVSVKNVKFEEGSIATPWCPNSSDALATTIGLNSTTEYDISGFQNNGTKTGTFTYISDTPKYDVSQVFSGSQRIEAPFNPGNSPTFTVAGWFYHTSGTTYYAAKDTYNTFISLESGRYFVYNSAGSPYVGNWTSTVNTWQYIVLVHDAAATKLKLYVNGSFVSEVTTNGTIYGSDILDIGGRQGVAQYSGRMSDFRIYATALSAEDIAQLYSENKLS